MEAFEASSPIRSHRTYELKAVALLSVGFGLVGLDRFIIHPLFPVISQDLALSYQDLGLISGIFALCWGLSSIFAGRLADRVGCKKVLVPAVIIFSILVACSGLAGGMISLLLIRGLMGLAEGAYVPASIVSTTEASAPERVGLNVGIQQMAAPLVGLGMGPLIATSLLKIVPSWHWIFGLVAIPGLFTAWLMHRVLRDARRTSAPAAASLPARVSPWRAVLSYRNVTFNALVMSCCLSCVMILSVFMPNYLTDQRGLSLDQMARVLAGFGIGSFIGMAVVPAISDKLGRRVVVIVALVMALAALWTLQRIGAEPVRLFWVLFAIGSMTAGAVVTIVGPLTGGSVPKSLAATATGIVVGVGEVIGGAAAPVIAGHVAQRFGLETILSLSWIAIAAGLLIAIFGVLEPTAPAAIEME